MTTVLKLGGSVVTVKDEPETVDESRLEVVAADIGETVDSRPIDLVVVHGGGSFGHHHAAAHGVSATDGTHSATAIREVHGAMQDLNDTITAALADHGIPALPVHPLSLASRRNEGDLRLPGQPVETMVDEGFVPVLHGDVVAQETKGATILSGDDIVVSLAQSLEAERVGLCSTVPGVLDDEGEIVPSITAFEEVDALVAGSDSTDVTGGMAGKINALLGLETPASIFGPSALADFLRGESPGTLVGAER